MLREITRIQWFVILLRYWQPTRYLCVFWRVLFSSRLLGFFDLKEETSWPMAEDKVRSQSWNTLIIFVLKWSGGCLKVVFLFPLIFCFLFLYYSARSSANIYPIKADHSVLLSHLSFSSLDHFENYLRFLATFCLRCAL